MIPGEYFLSDEPIIANKNRETRKIKVSNSGDRPIQVGSHLWSPLRRRTGVSEAPGSWAWQHGPASPALGRQWVHVRSAIAAQ